MQEVIEMLEANTDDEFKTYVQSIFFAFSIHITTCSLTHRYLRGDLEALQFSSGDEKNDRIKAIYKYYRAAQKSLLTRNTCTPYDIKIVKHLLLPSSLATLGEEKIVTKIISDGTAFGFHVEDAHRRKIREWERFAVTHDDAFEENNERRKSVSEESDCVFVEFMLAKWEYCMLEMGKSDPKRVLQAAQAFAVVMGLEDHLYSLEHSKTDLCQEITSKLTAPGRFNSSRRNSFRKDSLRKMRRQGRRWKRNVMPDHVAPNHLLERRDVRHA